MPNYEEGVISLYLVVVTGELSETMLHDMTTIAVL